MPLVLVAALLQSMDILGNWLSNDKTNNIVKQDGSRIHWAGKTNDGLDRPYSYVISGWLEKLVLSSGKLVSAKIYGKLMTHGVPGGVGDVDSQISFKIVFTSGTSGDIDHKAHMDLI